MFGAPGETPETIAETLAVMQEYAIPLGVWVTLGVYLWTDYQELVGELRREGYQVQFNRSDRLWPSR